MSPYEEALLWLNQVASERQFFSNNKLPSLENVNAVLDELGRPDEHFDWRVVVGGTAGKGTCVRMIESVLVEAGLSVTSLISPHLQVETERIRINGRLITSDLFGESILKIKTVTELLDLNITYYEAIVLAGVLAGKTASCKILLCEVGCGGEFDAVNAVRGRRIAGLTFIGEDHLDILGGTLEKVAETKAGIFTPDTVYGFSYEKKYCSIIKNKSNTNIQFIKGIKSKLNKKLARNISEKILENKAFTMSKQSLPGRWEKVEDRVLLDGAHSTPRFEYLVSERLQKSSPKYVVIFGMQKNHHPKDFASVLPYAEEVFWTQLPNSKDVWTAEELQQHFKTGKVITDPIEALRLAQEKYPDSKILVTGSYYLVGHLRDQFYPSELILKQQTEFPVLK